jgi:regulator of sirC expression with transglutaminase-like and TPR domain
MATGDSARERFAALAAGPEETVDVAEAALVIAAEAYPALRVDEYLAKLDALAEEARPWLGFTRSELERVARLNHFLFVEKGFAGNQEQYYDRRNSFLNEVLDRRKGIPITLAVVYTEVGRRLGLPLFGVGFPGHFLAKYAGEREIIIDPFFGLILSEEDCHERLQHVLGQGASFERRYLAPAAPKQILVRMLNNLKHIYLEAKEFEQALSCCERILLLTPEHPQELRDRGLLYYHLECYSAAQNDLERFLALAPEDETADAVRSALIAVRRHAAQIH